MHIVCNRGWGIVGWLPLIAVGLQLYSNHHSAQLDAGIRQELASHLHLTKASPSWQEIAARIDNAMISEALHIQMVQEVRHHLYGDKAIKRQGTSQQPRPQFKETPQVIATPQAT